jgi:RNA polymerase sigma factor (sigma-70 family)
MKKEVKMRPIVKGRGFTHSFQQPLAQPLSQEEKIKARDTENWDVLIESHMRLGCSIAGRYVSFGGDSEEMVSAAMLGIVEAVDRIRRGVLMHDNITGYIVHYIHQHCGETRRKDCLMPVPRGVERIRRHPLTNENITTDYEIEEFYEIIECIIKTDTEKDILFFRQQGDTDEEVATKLCVSRSFVSQTRRELFERFKNVQRKCG